MIIQEGKGKIFYPEDFLKKLSSKLPIFYNPNMKINRDFTIYILKAHYDIYKKKLDILDAMASTGIRSIRIIKEVPYLINTIVINDIKKETIENIKKNLEINEIKDGFEIQNKDCRSLMYERKFDYIDIDPFGTPVSFIQPALISLRHKGILGVTATDISALSGSKREACYRKYNTIGDKTSFYLEFGLRNLIKFVILEAYKLDIYVRPIFGYYYLHHYRVFFIKERKKDVINNIRKIYYCNVCGYANLEGGKCKICNNDMKELGPIYIGDIYDKEFLERIYKEEYDKKERKIIDRIYNCDSKKKIWFYYDIRKLQSYYKKPLPKIEYFIDKFNACRTHFSDYGIKTEELIFI